MPEVVRLLLLVFVCALFDVGGAAAMESDEDEPVLVDVLLLPKKLSAAAVVAAMEISVFIPLSLDSTTECVAVVVGV